MLVFLALKNEIPLRAGIAVHLFIPRDPELVTVPGIIGIQIFDE